MIKKKRILVDGVNSGEIRTALVEQGCIIELACDSEEKKQLRGNIYVGFITRIEPSLQALFVDYGSERQGFLPIDELSPEYCHASDNKRYRNISDMVHVGQKLVVQAIKDERRNKGATLTTYISLVGRVCALMLNVPSGQGSVDSTAPKYEKVFRELNLPSNASISLRQDVTYVRPEHIKADYTRLTHLWEVINLEAENAMIPTLLHEEGSALRKMLNHYLLDENLTEVVIEGENLYTEVISYVARVSPECSKKIIVHNSLVPIFSYYAIETQIDALYSNRVQLNSGGYIVIDSTEALVAIDVNSGRMTRSTTDVESTALKTNLEATREIAQQVRLRGLAGIIVIDFISMSSHANNRIVERELANELAADRARIKMNKINEFGLMELSRQRMGVGLHELSTLVCSHCNGTGFTRSIRATAQMFIKKLKAALSVCHSKTIDVEMSPELMAYLMNNSAKHLLDMQSKNAAKPNYKISHDVVDFTIEHGGGILNSESCIEYKLTLEFMDEFIEGVVNA